MTEDVKKRFDALSEYEQSAVKAIMEAWEYSIKKALSEYEQSAVKAIMEAWGYSIEKALDVVERGDFEFYPEIFTLADLACELVETGRFGDLETMGVLAEFIDYERFGAYLYRYDNYMETSQGVVRIRE